MAQFNANKRRLSRRLLLQALYQWHISKNDLNSIEDEFKQDNNLKKADAEYFHELLHQIPANLKLIDDSFKTYLDRDIKDLNPIELTMLRIGTYELLKRPDIPYKAVINEAINLTKKFGTVEGYKYVNGILDQVAGVHRQVEKD